MRKFFVVVMVVLFSVSLVLAAQPKLKTIKVEPQTVTTGEKAKMTVEFTGSKEDIKEVYFEVREYIYEAPRYTLAPDAASKGNVWILEQTVPYDAPSGEMHLDITAVDKDGNKIVTKDLDQQAVGTTGTVKIEIKY
jgi:hypothetical protein